MAGDRFADRKEMSHQRQHLRILAQMPLALAARQHQRVVVLG